MRTQKPASGSKLTPRLGFVGLAASRTFASTKVGTVVEGMGIEPIGIPPRGCGIPDQTPSSFDVSVTKAYLVYIVISGILKELVLKLNHLNIISVSI